MSLRTKLLAVAVGLPVAILLLALVLFVRRGTVTPQAAMDDVIHNASRDRASALATVLAHDKRGSFVAIYRVRLLSMGKGRELKEGVWLVRDWDAGGVHAPQVSDPALRKTLLERYAIAADRSCSLLLDTQYLAVHAKGIDDEERHYGYVCKLHEERGAAKAVYWVMVGGIGLITIVFFWMISRWVIGPLRKLTGAADRIADGEYRVRIEPHSAHDEFGRTIRGFNRMALEIGEYQGHLEDRVLTALGRIKKTEQHLTIAQRLAATGKLASGLAHEINNPLGGMKNAVRSLARGDLSPEKTELYLDLIADGLNRVEQTVKKFLSFTPRQAAPRPADLGDIAEKSVALAMHRIEKKGIQVETQVPARGEAIVFGDPHELQQVALNLVLNAADAMEAGGDGMIRVVVRHGPEEVVLRVADNGSGMSADDQQHCFDMFFTTKGVGEGSGMGLAVVHNIVTNHGGRIELTSALGTGTTFEVYLPREAAPGADSADEDAPDKDSPDKDAPDKDSPERAAQDA